MEEIVRYVVLFLALGMAFTMTSIVAVAAGVIIYAVWRAVFGD